MTDVVNSSIPVAAPVVSPAMLDTLSTRFGGAAVCLALFSADAGQVQHRPGIVPFFSRFVLPALELGRARLAERFARLTPGAVAVWSALPGVLLAAVPCFDKRRLSGVVALLAKTPAFTAGEEVLRHCGQLQLDAQWLSHQAERTPSLTAPALQVQAELLASVLRDQLRLSSFEEELNSLSGELADTYEELSLIYQISSGMKVNRSAADFFQQACRDLMDVVNVRGMGVVLSDPSGRRTAPVLHGSTGLSTDQVQRLAGELMSLLARRSGALLVNELNVASELAWLAPVVQRLIAVPLACQDQLVGCLFGLDKLDGDFDSVDSKLLGAIANQSAIYLENLKLFDDAHGLMMGLLHALTSAVDAKDTYTCGHSERVAFLARTLAREAGLNEEQAQRAYMAGLLHDVGKIGVPESVLQKTGKLTEDEFGQMKRHPQVGARILQDIEQLADVTPGVLHHHERFDGRGYPAALAGEQIPLLGRIICLADSFDAMTSNRTYRRALPIEVALTEIRRGAATQFDPVLAERFLRLDFEQFRLFVQQQQHQVRPLLDVQRFRRLARS